MPQDHAADKPFQGREGWTVPPLSQGTLTASPVAVPAFDRAGKILCGGDSVFNHRE